MQLTTPEPTDKDIIFPGENFFLYWKTSASLWESKLSTFKAGTKVLIPINWSFHSNGASRYDFGLEKPEADLKRIEDICNSLNLSPNFLIPISPCPFIPNGGLPHYLARKNATSRDGLTFTVIESEGQVHKIYSFFEPSVFQGFVRFCDDLGQYFSTAGVASGVWALDNLYIEGQEVCSFISDRSSAFLQSFSRFLKTKKEEQGDFVVNSLEEDTLIEEYTADIKNLYKQTLEEKLSSNWEGVLPVSYYGAAPNDIFDRFAGPQSNSKNFNSLFESLTKTSLPSSSLLSFSSKAGVFGKAIQDLVMSGYLDDMLTSSFFEQEDAGRLRALQFFRFIVPEEKELHHSSWNSSGLIDVIKDTFGWSYCQQDFSNDIAVEDDIDEHSYYFFEGKELGKKELKTVLKVFMSGGKCVLDRDSIDPNLLKSLEVFFLENDLRVEKVNFTSLIYNIQLSSGRLIILNTGELMKQKTAKRSEFWKTLISTFDIEHLNVEFSEGLQYFWRFRAALDNELKFEEVRRVNIYNPTSYKKKVRARHVSNFALLKIIDDHHVSVNTQSSGIEIELLPGGSVALDIGFYH